MFHTMPFFTHPAANGMSYWQHWSRSMGFCVAETVGALKAFVHAWWPDVFTESTTNLGKWICAKSGVGSDDIWDDQLLSMLNGSV